MSSCTSAGTAGLVSTLKNSKPSLPLITSSYIGKLQWKMSLQLYDYKAIAVISQSCQNRGTASVGRDLERSSGPTFHGKEPSWDYLAPFPTAAWKPPVMHLPCLFGELFQWAIVLIVKNVLCWGRTSSGATCAHCPVASPRGSLWSESLCPLRSHPLHTGVLWWDPLEPSLLQEEKT